MEAQIVSRGASAFVRKPFEFHVLAATARALLERPATLPASNRAAERR
jgi:DNA-binding response OmpR family regulator